MSAQKGFTKIEILIVILLVGVLIGVLVYGSGTIQKRLGDDQRVRFMKEITVALETYRDEFGHYPYTGDKIPSGTVVSGNDSFKSMMTALGQGGFLEVSKLVDPSYGSLFTEFDGVDSYGDGAKFSEANGRCDGNNVLVQKVNKGDVFYAYFSPDGRTYVMCVGKENGETGVFVSPKFDKLN